MIYDDNGEIIEVLPSAEFLNSIERARNAPKDRRTPMIVAKPAPPSIAITKIIANGGKVPLMIDSTIRDAKVEANYGNEWKQRMEDQGIKFIRHDYLPLDLYECLQYMGFELLYSQTRACFIIRNPHIENWADWQEIRPDKQGIGAMARAKNLMGYMIGHFVSTKDDQDRKAYKVVPIKAGAWGKGAELYGNLIALKGELIPVINEYEAWVNDKLAQIEKMTPADKDFYTAQLDFIFDDMPGIAPITPHDAIIARHAGRYIMTMIAHRIIQDHPAFTEHGFGRYARTIRPQREVPIICGEPDVGKSTIWENLIPKSDLFSVGKMKFSADANLMGRACAGQIMMIANEMSRIRVGSAAAEVIKGFIAEPTITFDEKYERNKTISMPSVFVSTANEVKLPHDKALRSRFVLFRLDVDHSLDQYHELIQCAETRGQAIVRYCAENRDAWLMGGLILAIANQAIQCPKSYANNREIIARNIGDEVDSELVETLMQMLTHNPKLWSTVNREKENSGIVRLAASELALAAGVLRWQRHILDGEGKIMYAAGTGIMLDQLQHLTHDDLKMAYDEARRRDAGLADRITGAFRSIGWINRTAKGASIRFRKSYPTNPRYAEIRQMRGFTPAETDG